MTAEPIDPRPEPVLRAEAVSDVMSDAELAVATMRDRAALAVVYDRYADRLYDFCVGMLRDPHAAADCVQDTFATAATSLAQLREPDKLRAWLYAVARHEALRRLRGRDREQPAEALPEHGSPDPGPEALAARSELADLIAQAAGGLSDRDRTLLELHYRHGLDGPELADALGVSQTNANTLVGRLRTTIERSLGALLLARAARSGQLRCPELSGVLAGWDGAFTVLWRKRIARHLDHCPDCDRARHAMVNPRALLGTVPVFLPAPLWLRGHTLASVPPPGAAAPAGAAGPGAGPGGNSGGNSGGDSGWPPSDHTEQKQTPRVSRGMKVAGVAAAAAIATVVILLGVLPTGRPAAADQSAVPPLLTAAPLLTSSPRAVAAAPSAPAATTPRRRTTVAPPPLVARPTTQVPAPVRTTTRPAPVERPVPVAKPVPKPPDHDPSDSSTVSCVPPDPEGGATPAHCVLVPKGSGTPN